MKKILSILLVSVILIGCGGSSIMVKTDWNNGDGKIERHYKNGKNDGIWKKWYKNDQLQYEKNYKDGEIIFEKCWDEDGNEIECE